MVNVIQFSFTLTVVFFFHTKNKNKHLRLRQLRLAMIAVIDYKIDKGSLKVTLQIEHFHFIHTANFDKPKIRIVFCD